MHAMQIAKVIPLCLISAASLHVQATVSCVDERAGLRWTVGRSVQRWPAHSGSVIWHEPLGSTATFPDPSPSSTHYPLSAFGAWILSPLVFHLGPPVY